jgi:hypothetical protein
MKKNMIKLMKNSLLLMLALVCSSCLKSGLDDLPAFEEADITDVKFDFRYKDLADEWIDGQPIVKVVTLTVGDKVINAEAGTITCSVTVPPAAGSFTEDIRGTVALTNLTGKFNLSTAAVIAPLDGAPVLGVPGDFSAARSYLVTAADGTEKSWTIQVTALNK